MSKIDEVRADMVKAMKAGDKERMDKTGNTPELRRRRHAGQRRNRTGDIQGSESFLRRYKPMRQRRRIGDSRQDRGHKEGEYSRRDRPGSLRRKRRTKIS